MRQATYLTAALGVLTQFFTEGSGAGIQPSYSRWMASGIMVRQQGIMTGNGGTSELLQAGFTQKAFLALLDQQPDVQSVREYIETSAASVVPFVLNATHDALSYPLDRLSNGQALLKLSSSSTTGAINKNQSFGAAADALRQSINLNRRNPEGGLWYFVYPEWSYLDGMYSLAPFYTLYTKTRSDGSEDAAAAKAALDDMYFQIDLLWRRTRHEETGLLVHGYDASRVAVWADPHTGASPYVWDRALGWYFMALVDTLELLHSSPSPSSGSGGSEYEGPLLEKFQDLAKAVIAAADPATGAWWQIMDQPGREGNYIESSGSAMFAYALLKGTRLGYLESCASDAVRVGTRAQEYLTKTFVVHEKDDILGYNGTVSVCSLNSTATYEVSSIRPLLNGCGAADVTGTDVLG